MRGKYLYISMLLLGLVFASQAMDLDAYSDLCVLVTVECVEDDPIDDDERVYIGSGFVLDATTDTIYVMTARHILGLQDLLHADTNSPDIKTYEVVITFPSGARRPATSFLLNRYHDIALLVVPNTSLLDVNEDFYPAHIDTTLNLDVEDRVIAIGYQFGQAYPSCVDGIISAFPPDLVYSSDSTIASPLIQHNASTNPGNSGGPLILVENGQYSLVGMNIGEPPEEWGGRGDIGYALNLGEIFDVTGSIEAQYIHVDCTDPDNIDEAIDQLDDVGYENMDPTLLGSVVVITGVAYAWVVILERASDLWKNF